MSVLKYYGTGPCFVTTIKLAVGSSREHFVGLASTTHTHSGKSILTEKNDVLLDNDPCQSGFMKDRMTTDNAFILYSLIMKQKFLKKPLYVCFVDFTKAFDYVNRAALMYKLKQRWVGGSFLKVIKSMYENSKCRVKVDGVLSEEIESLFGVLQGGIIRL